MLLRSPLILASSKKRAEPCMEPIALCLRDIIGCKRIDFCSRRFRLNAELTPNSLIRSGTSRLLFWRGYLLVDLTYSLLQIHFENFDTVFSPFHLLRNVRPTSSDSNAVTVRVGQTENDQNRRIFRTSPPGEPRRRRRMDGVRNKRKHRVPAD